MSGQDLAALTPSFSMAGLPQGRSELPVVSELNVSEPEFLKALETVVAATDLAELKTYLRWHVVASSGAVPVRPPSSTRTSSSSARR